jgi:predicted permease
MARPSLLARLLARAYPPALRRSHGADIAETLSARWRERRGLGARLRLAGELIGDVAATWRQQRVPLMRNVSSDVRDAIRLFRRGPLFAAGAVVTLALGVGTTSAILSLAYATVLRPLPIPEADRVVQSTFSFSHPDFRDLAAQHRTLTDLSAWTNAQFALERHGETVQVLGAGVSGRYFALAGQAAIAGRLLQESDDTSAGPARAVISERLWTRVYHRDPQIVGATVLVNRQPVSITGVFSAAFRGTSLQFAPELFVTLAHIADLSPGFLSRPGTMTSRGTVFLNLAGRLKPGTNADQASDDARRLYYAARPPNTKPDTGAWFTAMLPEALGRRTSADLRRFVTLLVGASALTMLLTCATVANLLLVRADRRRHELGVRAALGAGQARLSRLLLVESLAIGAAGGLAGVAVAWGTLQLLGTYALPGQVAIVDLGLAVDARLLLATGALGLITALVFGLAPVRHARHVEAAAVLRSGPRFTSRGRFRAALVGVQVALCVVLLGGSVAFGRAMSHALALDLGFNVGETTITTINPSLARYTDERAADLRRRTLEALLSRPGIRAAGWSLLRPLSGAFILKPIAEGEAAPPEGPGRDVHGNVVTDGYFEALQIPVTHGRSFSRDDLRGELPLVVVSASLAGRLWPSTPDPVGRRISLEDPGSSDMKWWSVIGVAADIHRQVGGPPVPMLYLPDGRVPPSFSPDYLMVRSAGPLDPVIADIRATLRSLDPNVPITASVPMSRHVMGPLMAHRLGLMLFALFAGLAIVLTGFGLYAVVATAVSQRTREIGIRVALGAEAGRVLGFVARQGLWPVGIGLAAGLGALAFGARLIQSFMFSLPVVSAGTLFVVCGVVAAGALLAMFVPARRALAVDPTVALRAE